MTVSSICVDDNIKKETTEIANQMGLTLDSVINILLRMFVAEKGFPVPNKAEKLQPKSLSDMTIDEFEKACQKAVAEREPVPTFEYTTMFDEKTGRIYKKYKDGRIVYALD